MISLGPKKAVWETYLRASSRGEKDADADDNSDDPQDDTMRELRLLFAFYPV